jgi:hypothetical protein
MRAGSLAAAPSLFLSLAGSMAAEQGLFGSKRIRPLSGEVRPLLLLLQEMHEWFFFFFVAAVAVPFAVDVVGGVYEVKAGAVAVEGGNPLRDDGRVDVGVHVSKTFAQVRSIFCPIFVSR